MDGLTRSIRVIFGLGMLAAGTTLAAPTALTVARWWRQAPTSAAVPQAFPAIPPTAPQQVTAWPAPAAPGLEAAPPVAWPGPATAAAPVARSEYRPPAPPAPLPPAATGAAGPNPDLSAAYRSTLAVPPPPLIDGQRPPPVAVGWTARFSREVQQRRELQPPPATSYRVRDGDDLTGIASRFYGTPAAASLIWQANRGLLADPAVLPIGIELVLPRPDAAGGYGASIDPPLGQPGLPATQPAPVRGDPWLQAAP
ncbi:MAG: LysM peptidoglycan-binding domain-containing protein [Planctomycetota bacterium]